jgi:CheY-like chemotaxis protein
MSRPLCWWLKITCAPRTLVEILHWEDIDTVTAGTGKEALNLLREQCPDLVILDMELPGGMRGIDVLRCIRADPRLSTTPVVLHTAEPGVMSLIEAEAADLVLLKPVSPDDLLTLVQRLL